MSTKPKRRALSKADIMAPRSKRLLTVISAPPPGGARQPPRDYSDAQAWKQFACQQEGHTVGKITLWASPASLAEAGKVRQALENMSSLTEFNRMAAERMMNIVTTLRTFTRLDRADEDEVDIHECLDTLTLIYNELRERITVHKGYGDVPQVRCHPSQLNQVYMNLLRNAAQAIHHRLLRERAFAVWRAATCAC